MRSTCSVSISNVITTRSGGSKSPPRLENLVSRTTHCMSGVGNKVAKLLVISILSSKVMYGQRFYRLSKKHLNKIDLLLNNARRTITGLPKHTKMDTICKCAPPANWKDRLEKQLWMHQAHLEHTRRGRAIAKLTGMNINHLSLPSHLTYVPPDRRCPHYKETTSPKLHYLIWACRTHDVHRLRAWEDLDSSVEVLPGSTAKTSPEPSSLGQVTSVLQKENQNAKVRAQLFKGQAIPALACDWKYPAFLCNKHSLHTYIHTYIHLVAGFIELSFVFIATQVEVFPSHAHAESQDTSF